MSDLIKRGRGRPPREEGYIKPTIPEVVNINLQAFNTFMDTMAKRNAILLRRAAGAPFFAWTEDEIYKQYRFCNVFRWADKTTQLLFKLKEMLPDVIKWGVIGALRWTACNPLISTVLKDAQLLSKLSTVSSVKEGATIFEEWLRGYNGQLVTGSFYVRMPAGKEAWIKCMMLTFNKCIKIVADMEWIPVQNRRIQDMVDCVIKQIRGNASFSAYCIVTDWMYDNKLLGKAVDKYTWAAKGKGGINGLSLLYENEDYARIKWDTLIPEVTNMVRANAERFWNDTIYWTGDLALSKLKNSSEGTQLMNKLKEAVLDFTALDTEHWLCEYAKYIRGYARRRYWYDDTNEE